MKQPNWQYLPIIENLKAGLIVIEAAPEEQFDLRRFVAHPAMEEDYWSCGTLACAAGWIALDDTRAGRARKGRSERDVDLGKLVMRAQHVAYDGERFGARSFDFLFAARANGEYDYNILAQAPNLSDKQLAVERFKRHIAAMEACHKADVESFQIASRGQEQT